jgi:hypothetical protein
MMRSLLKNRSKMKQKHQNATQLSDGLVNISLSSSHFKPLKHKPRVASKKSKDDRSQSPALHVSHLVLTQSRASLNKSRSRERSKSRSKSRSKKRLLKYNNDINLSSSVKRRRAGKGSKSSLSRSKSAGSNSRSRILIQKQESLKESLKESLNCANYQVRSDLNTSSKPHLDGTLPRHLPKLTLTEMLTKMKQLNEDNQKR